MRKKLDMVFLALILFMFNTLSAQSKWITPFDFSQEDLLSYLDNLNKNISPTITQSYVIIEYPQKEFQVRYDFEKTEDRIRKISLSHQLASKKEIAEKVASIVSYMRFHGEIFLKMKAEPNQNEETYFSLTQDQLIQFIIEKKKKYSTLSLFIKPNFSNNSSTTLPLLNELR